MKKKNIIRIIVCLCIYLLLLYLLQSFESAQTSFLPETGVETSDPKINTFGSAFWYSLVTLTTVGYGDIVPHSTVGKLIGGIFVLLSTFLIAFLIGIVLSLMRGKLLPIVRLALSRGKRWYIFEDWNSRTQMLGNNLLEEDPQSVIIFAGCGEDGKERPEEAGQSNPYTQSARSDKSVIVTDLRVEEVLERASGKEKCTIFCMGENGFDNYLRAAGLLKKDIFSDNKFDVCCMTEYEPDRYPTSLTLFDPYSACARLYWMQHPVHFSGRHEGEISGDKVCETILLIGSGKYAEAILEQALLVNVFGPSQKIRYLVHGDFAKFRRNHPCLRQISSLAVSEPSSYEDGSRNSCHVSSKEQDQISPVENIPVSDLLLFKDEPWDEDFYSIKLADRIIICYDSEEEALSVFNTLHRYIPTGAEIHARLSCDFDRLTCFGAPGSLFTPETVLRKQLDQQARTLHETYLKGAGQTSPGWEELSAFLRRSNNASADHLYTKIRILLGEDAGLPLIRDTLGQGNFPSQSGGGDAVFPMRKETIIETSRETKRKTKTTKEMSGNLAKEAYAAAFKKWREEWPEKKDLFRWVEHERWMRFYLLNNWQYCEKRDNSRRLHPLIRPFDQLPEKEQEKDDYAWEMLGTLAENF